MAKRRMSKPAMMAREIRKELKEKFPMTKFSVRSKSYSGGGSVKVTWTDWPTIEAVSKVTAKHEQVHKCEATGETLLGANYFVFTEQELSDELREKAESKLPEDVQRFNRGYFMKEILKEMYKEVKGLYEGEHHAKREKLSQKQKKSGNEIKMKDENKAKPATKRQLWALHCMTNMDTRKWKLTRQEASDMILKLKNDSNIDINIKAIH